MKIIKYRAWSEKIGAFIFWQSDQDTPLGMFWELCQSEGLEPEMGIEMTAGETVYEEDIVNQQNRQNADIYIGKVMRAFKGQWCLNLGGFHFPSLGSNYILIGNTHQNPELIPKD